MKELEFNFPEGFLTPEENARFLKYKADTIAFYEKHGDHLEWLQQAQDLGLMEEARPLTPDELQYIEETAKLAEEHKDNLKDIISIDDFAAAQERFQTIKHLKSESEWLQDLTNRKKADAGKSLLDDLETLLTACNKYNTENPGNEKVTDYIVTLKEAIAALSNETTVLELNLDAKKMQSEN
jgi:hypothetical protein